VTGESLREYARKNLFEPLGMSSTHFHDDPGHVMADRVISYVRTDDGAYRIADLPNFDKIGAGGLYTTIEDLLKWDQNFYEPRVGGEGFLKQLHTRGVLNRGDTLSYAFGLTVGTHRGLPTVHHGGSLMGFRAELLRFPEQRLTVAVLCNLGNIAPSGLAERVAAVYLDDRMLPAPVAVAAPGRDVGESQGDPAPAYRAGPLPPYVGDYRSEEVQATYRVVLQGTDLVLERRAAAPAPLLATAADNFRAGSLELRFERDATGAVTAFIVRAGRVQNMRFDRVR
jgi:hypothetical protein